jgi:hypothetical protein
MELKSINICVDATLSTNEADFFACIFLIKEERVSMSDDLQSGSDPEEQRSKPQEGGPVEDVASAQESLVDDATNNPPVNPVSPPFGYGPNSGAILPQEGFGLPLKMSVMPPATPLPLWTAVRQLPSQYWYVLRHLQPATFVQEDGKAAWNIIWVQLLILGVAEALHFLSLDFFEFSLSILQAPSTEFLIIAIPTLFGIIVLVSLCFFIGAGILHLIAKAFGGRASFLSYCYGCTLILTPISLASLALAIIPCIGLAAGLAGSIFAIVALIYMTMGIQRLSGGRASAVVLILVAIGVLLCIGVYVAFFIFIFSLMPHSH